MGLTLIIGPANSGKTGAVRRFIERAGASRQPALLVPGAPEVARAELEFAALSPAAARVQTVDDYVSHEWLLHGDGRPIVGDSVRSVLIRRALGSVAGIDEVFATDGFARLVDAVARRTVDSLAPTTGSSALVAQALEAYWTLLEEYGYIELANAAHILSRRPEGLGRAVALNNFADLAPWQERFAIAASEFADVAVALTWDAGTPATEALTPTVQKLRAVAQEVVQTGGDEWTDPGLRELAGRIFSGVAIDSAPTSLELGLAAGADAECALVARAARRAIRGAEGSAQVAVVFKDVSTRAPMLSAALAAEGLDAQFDVAIELGRTAFGKTYLGLMRAAKPDNVDRDHLLGILLGPYAGVSADEASRADGAWRARRLDGQRLLVAARGLAGLSQALEASCSAMSGPLTPETASRWVAVADLMLANAHRRRGLEGYEGALDAGCQRAICRAVADLAEIDRGADPDEVLSILERQRVSTAQRERAGGIVVTEAHRVRGRRFDTVVLGGLTASEFSTGRPEPLSAELLRHLGQPVSDERLSERALFYSIITRARRQLVLIRQGSDDRGEAVRPSTFWEEVLDLYRVADDPELRIPDGVAVQTLSLGDIASAAPVFSAGRRAARSAAVEQRAPAASRGRIADPTVLEGLASTEEFSVSEIETYLQCPYRWFYDRAVRPRELGRELDARERGTRAHAILKRFYDAWHASGHARVGHAVVSKALETLTQVASEVEREARVEAVGVAEELSAAAASRWARAIVEDDASFLPGFAPAAHEFAFGAAHDKPVVIGGVALRGSIDRVEKGPSGIVVIDYKSSASVQGIRSFDSYGLVQPSLYALAAQELMGAPAVGAFYRSLRSLAVRGFFLEGALDLGDRATASDRVDEAGLVGEYERAAAAVAQAASGIRAGEISPRPRKPAVCGYCALRGMCGRVA